MIFITIHKISYYKVRVSTGSVEPRWLGDSFLMAYRNNTGRLGSGFISVCLETRWLGHLGGCYVPERLCMQTFWCFGNGARLAQSAFTHTHAHNTYLQTFKRKLCATNCAAGMEFMQGFWIWESWSSRFAMATLSSPHVSEVWGLKWKRFL